MKLCIDAHHGGLWRSLLLTFQDRLGHEVWSPDRSLCEWANQKIVGTWLVPDVSAAGGVPERHLDASGNFPNLCSRDQFLSTDWDAVIMSRPESEPLFRELLAEHPKGMKIKRIGQAGNEAQKYDWTFVPNFLSSDYLSFHRAPNEINKIHYFQELGRQFCPDEFTPLTEENLLQINTFINCLSSFHDWRWDKEMSGWGGLCPHCESRPEQGPSISVRDIWANMKAHLPEYNLLDFGIINSQGVIPEKQLWQTILSGALSFSYKTYDGYGHSIAQSISMGRLCLIPRRFHKYRTANQFLIPNLTCLECDWTAESCISTIRWFTASLDRANAYSEACFKAARGIFNWELTAFRVKEFMDKLQ